LLSNLDCTKLEHVTSLNAQRKHALVTVRTRADHIERHDVSVLVGTNPSPALYNALATRRGAYRPRAMELFHSTSLSNVSDKI
jgi:hypothetical protein